MVFLYRQSSGGLPPYAIRDVCMQYVSRSKHILTYQNTLAGLQSYYLPLTAIERGGLTDIQEANLFAEVPSE
jgi:hypothetical protein